MCLLGQIKNLLDYEPTESPPSCSLSEEVAEDDEEKLESELESLSLSL